MTSFKPNKVIIGIYNNTANKDIIHSISNNY